MTVQEYVDKVIDYLTIEPENVEVREEDEYVFINIFVPEDDAGKMIGKHGETISSLAHLVSVSFHDELTDKKVVVDINDYKNRREEESIEMGRQAAKRVVETLRPHHMPRSLHAHQRRAVHHDLQSYEGVYTQSEGEGRDRHMVIYPEGYEAEE
ncbi:KH domain-containing protein [Candidatus Woesebacteria bacterium]|nr:KH domain-containing protein [Candidatus Woesebacteria bacterium]MCD8507013.1 KH domain-containing protein [Candidatus Woesebacteria bacterium]MCD8527304.1 KH domain-containing protein [Candidatus Woesebacteria bacterium]MCD8546669.1 KH domain-containing protein [Candidatus Woesebacteria bacterium]